jgi:hypothetical protein
MPPLTLIKLEATQTEDTIGNEDAPKKRLSVQFRVWWAANFFRVIALSLRRGITILRVGV